MIGEFHEWQRHGYGIQRWISGEIYRGTWKYDQQYEGNIRNKD